MSNAASLISLQPSSERLSAKLDGLFKINDNTQAFADLWVSRNDTSSSEGPVGFSSSSTFFNPLTQGIGLLDNNGHIPAGASNNPTGVDTSIHYVFPEALGVRTVSNFVRAATGVKGSFSTPVVGDWDWQASYTHSQDVVSNTYSNVLGVSQLNNILQNGAFNFNNPALTPNGLNGLFQQDTTQGISKLDTVDLTASTPNLFKLPTGDVGFGIGAQFLHESEFINGITSNVVPEQVQSVNGERKCIRGLLRIQHSDHQEPDVRPVGPL